MFLCCFFIFFHPLFLRGGGGGGGGGGVCVCVCVRVCLHYSVSQEDKKKVSSQLKEHNLRNKQAKLNATLKQIRKQTLQNYHWPIQYFWGQSHESKRWGSKLFDHHEENILTLCSAPAHARAHTHTSSDSVAHARTPVSYTHLTLPTMAVV